MDKFYKIKVVVERVLTRERHISIGVENRNAMTDLLATLSKKDKLDMVLSMPQIEDTEEYKEQFNIELNRWEKRNDD